MPHGVTSDLANTVIDHTLGSSAYGWNSLTSVGGLWSTPNVAGWSQLKKTPGDVLESIDLLKIVPDELVVKPGETVILMMDVELLGIHPIYSDAVKTHLIEPWGRVNSMGTHEAHRFRNDLGNYGNFLLAERYLDLFALFAIGYKKDGDWVIASESVPATVNSFNWVNRSAPFSVADDFVWPMNMDYGLKALNRKGIMDGNAKFDDSNEDAWSRLGFWTKSKTPEGLYTDSFSLGYDWFGSAYPRLLRRGGYLHPSNLGVNIPIMQVITNTTTADLNITEFGGFVCSAVPQHWRDEMASGPGNPRKVTRGLESPDTGEPLDHPLAGPGTARTNNDYPWGDWISPACTGVPGRNILKGVKVRYRNARLTAIKVIE